MSKRKAVVNDIIFELDHDDVESSSEDDNVEAKKRRDQPSESGDNHSDISIVEKHIDVVEVDSSNDAIIEVSSPISQNGGKTECTIHSVAEAPSFCENSNDVDYNTKDRPANSHTEIFNEDIVIDSSDESDIVVGCENRKPLVTVMFNNKKVAKDYKKKIKEFMLKLIKLHDSENLTGSESETDLELDIWPEDLIKQDEEEKQESDNNLFFVDTAPEDSCRVEIPQYCESSGVLANNEEAPVVESPVKKRGPTCFNCNGQHRLHECKMPRNHVRINENRKAMNMVRVGRYHVEDEQKYGHIIPGRISGQLRHALGLRRDELPLHIYRMRLLGYPPGWLNEARISHSGITMFDSMGQAMLEPEEEDGEVIEPGSRDKFDIKKIIDFPGFNVPASSRYKEDAHHYNLPPMTDNDSKMNMLQVLAPNAMKAYKRKKLMLFPSAYGNDSLVQEGQAEMDIEDDEEVSSFPSVPPLPDEAPPPLPPPPPPLPDSPGGREAGGVPPPEQTETTLHTSADLKETTHTSEDGEVSLSDDELKSEPRSGLKSPSLSDLEEKKRLLLAALETSVENSHKSISDNIQNGDDSVQNNENVADKELTTSIDKESNNPIIESTELSTESNNQIPKSEDPTTPSKELTANDKQSPTLNRNTTDEVKETASPSRKSTDKQSSMILPEIKETASPSRKSTDKQSPMELSDQESSSSKETPYTPKQGHVKSTSYGTPILNVASPYVKLPSDDKFAKDICDIINFENLPDSTGKYKKICSLLKRVKREVDRIQDS